MNSVPDPPSRHHPWHVPRPGPKPPPGPERIAWLDQKLLHRRQGDIDALLDRIDPALRKDNPTSLDQEKAALEILIYLEGLNRSSGRPKTIQVLLAHLNLGFRHYTKRHNLKRLRLPIVGSFGLEDGILDDQSISRARVHRDMVQGWKDYVLTVLPNLEKLPAQDLAALIVTSAALFGGLAQEAHWNSLVAGLTEPIVTNGTQLYFELTDHRGTFPWLCDPVTEALIRRVQTKNARTLRGIALNRTALKRLLQSIAKRRTSRRQEASSSVIDELHQAALGALTTHFAPDVALISIGDLQPAPLPHAALERVLSISLPTAPASQRIDVVIQPRLRQSRQSGAMTTDLLDALKSGATFDTEESREEGVQTTQQDADDVRTEYVDNLRQKISENRHEHLRRHEERGTDARNTYFNSVCQFAEDIIATGGVRLEKLAAGSIAKYIAALINDLTGLAGDNSKIPDTGEREAMYIAGLQCKKDKSRSILETVIQLYERTVITHFGTDEVEWDHIPMSSRIKTVDANLVDPKTYQAILDTLELATCEDPEYPFLLAALVVILYRCGLRRGEAHEMRLTGIRFLENCHVIVRVYESILTSDKSKHVPREIGPVHLTEQEYRCLKRWFDARSSEAGFRDDPSLVYLFGRAGHGSQLLDDTSLFDPITELLHEISGDTNLRIHHFRHGFASRIFVSGRTPLAEVDEYPLRSKDWQRDFDEDGAWLRAFELGHVGPATSVDTYVHLPFLSHYFYCCRLVEDMLDERFLCALADLSARSLERTLARSPTAEKEQYDLTSRYLNSIRSRWPLSPPKHLRSPFKAKVIILHCVSRRFGGTAFRLQNLEFRKVVQIIGDYLVGQMDLNFWETQGFPAGVVREWLSTIDEFIELDILDASRNNRPALSDELQVLATNFLARLPAWPALDEVRHLFILCLVGMRSRSDDVRLAHQAAARLVELLGASDQSIFALKPTGRCTVVSLNDQVNDSKRSSRLKLLLIMLSVILLPVAYVRQHLRPLIAVMGRS
jgi:integrase